MVGRALDRAAEIATVFRCGGARLMGILHRPAAPLGCGVVVVPGAPQYRVGSHRQFVLLARELAALGYPVLRFDYRGMGDSDAPFAGFESVDEDIGAAIDHLFARVPGLRDAVLWGLCDGASAAAFYAGRDPRVVGIALVNPWVRSEASLARARVAHYYPGQLLSSAFWRRLARGEVNLTRSLRDAVSAWLAARTGDESGQRGGAAEPLSLRVGRSIGRFRGRILIVLSGADLTAQEFESAVLSSRANALWSGGAHVTVRRLNEANHTYSTQRWRARVHAWTIEWLAENWAE